MRPPSPLLGRLNRLLLHRHAFWLLFLPVVLVLVGIAIAIALSREHLMVRTVLALQGLTAKNSAALLEAQLQRHLQLLSGLSQDRPLQALLLAPGRLPDTEALASEFSRILQRDRDIDQVQWWTPQGSVLVERSEQGAAAHQDALRFFANEVMRLPAGQAMLSDFLLRPGQDGQPQHPLEPQLYLGTPQHDAQGQAKGALLLRLDLRTLLALQASEDRYGSSMQWLDRQGQWLYVNHPQELVATQGLAPRPFAQVHRSLWAQIGTQPQGQAQDYDGLWAWRTENLGALGLRADPLGLAQGPSVVLINKVQTQAIHDLRLLHFVTLVPVLLVGALLLLGLMWRWLLHHARASILAQKQLEMSNHIALIERWELDPATRQLHGGPSFQAHLGWTQECMDWDQFLAQLPQPAQRDALAGAVRHALAHGGSFDQEIALQPPGQATRWVRWVGLCERHASGRHLRCYGTAQDITPRKRLEQIRVEEQQRLSNIIEGTQVGTWDTDLRSGQLGINHHWARMLGYTVAELTPMSLERWLAMLHPEDRQATEAAVQQHLRAPERHPYAIRFRLRHRDGHWVWIAARGQLVERGPQGEPWRMLGTHTDVSDLVEARQRAEVASQAKTVFLSTMSHELRTPLNAILGFGQVLEHDEDLSGDQLESVQEILKAGRHLLALIEEILDLSKVEAGQLDLGLQALALAPQAQEALTLVQSMASSRRVSLAHRVAPELYVLADPLRLRQVLLNLLGNAIKYNQPGGQVLLGAEAQQDMVRLWVQDSGPGIAAEHLPHLFEPFQRGPAARGPVEGTGIGLAIAKGLVEKMQGQIGVDSTPGEGSTFWLTLPRAAAPELAGNTLAGTGTGLAPAAAAPQPTATEGWALPPPPQNTVLCIDDDPASLDLLTRLLRSQPGLQVVTSKDPCTAVALARQHHPALVLLDIEMPGMDGHAVLQALRADPALAPVPVVAVTANALPTDRARSLAAGFAAYVTKPFSVAELLGVLDTHLPASPMRHGGPGN